VRPSHHREGGGFRNPWPIDAERSFRDLLRWRRERRAVEPPVLPTPDELPLAAPRLAMPRGQPDDLRITWVGHATFLIQIGPWNVLTDPVWSERASPIPWAGPRRLVPPGIPFRDLPPIDAVILSHDHYDHLDDRTVRRLVSRHADGLHWIAPLGHQPWLQRRGARAVSELDWWAVRTLDRLEPALEITAYPAQHWTRRAPFVDSRRLWASFGLRAGAHHVFFGGDSGYGEVFRDIGQRTRAFDVVMLPIGAYAPRWFMRGAHMDPAEAVQAYCDIGGTGHFIAMHWGTFILTDEPVLEPPVMARDAWRAAGLPPANLSILRHGETLIVQTS
jgi:N-acyl-phosphatidylethanolamine-hydrolysing phospholipase D